MKCNPLRWLWGLLPVALLSWGAAQVTHSDIEADLKARVEDQLKGSGFKWARTGFSGRDGVITGTAADDADPGRAYDITRAVWGVRIIDNQATVIEKVDDYHWSASHVPGKLSLTGYVPNESARADILKLAKNHFPSDTIADDMKLARGVPSPEAWLDGVNFGLKQIAGLKTGEARMKGLALGVTGEAADLKDYARIKKALANDLPKTIKLVDDRVTAPTVKPFIWAAKQTGGQLMLSGFVPAKARDEILAAAKSAFPRNTVIEDRMEVAEGAANGHAAAVTTILRELAKLEEGSAEIRDQSVSVQGLATAPDIAEAARMALGRGLPQGFQMSEAIRVRESAGPRVVIPYSTAVQADASSVVLTGYAPSEAARDKLVQMVGARFPGRRIVNQLEVAPGAPDGWLKCFDGALQGTGRIGSGKAALTGRRMDVAAATDDEGLAGAIPGEIKSAVGADCDTSVRIDVFAEAPSDLVWRAAYNGSEVVLDGDVSSVAAKSALVAAAQRAFAGKRVVDRMRIVETRTRTWPTVAEQGLVSLAELQKGEATLARQQLTVVGQAADMATTTRIRERLGRNIAKGYTSRDDITVAAAAVGTPPPTPPAVAPAPAVNTGLALCQNSLQATAREGIIRFERASAQLTRESFPTLDRLATVVRNCPSVVVEIEGHTDSEGTPERKQALSDRRAQSVVEYLSRGGVDAQRLASIGYADTRPLAPNDSALNRAKNRRIEFTVKPR